MLVLEVFSQTCCHSFSASLAIHSSLFTIFFSFPYLSSPHCPIPALACFTKYLILSATKSTCFETELCFPASLIVFPQFSTSKDAWVLWLVMQAVDCTPLLSSLIAAFRGLGYDSAQYLNIACVHLGALLNFVMEYKPQMQGNCSGGESSGSCLQNIDGWNGTAGSGLLFYVHAFLVRDGCCIDVSTHDRGVPDVVTLFNLPATSSFEDRLQVLKHSPFRYIRSFLSAISLCKANSFSTVVFLKTLRSSATALDL